MSSIQQKYTIVDIIGEGTFGTILCIQDRSDGKLYACKIEKATNIKEVLVQKEYEALKELEVSNRFPKVYDFKLTTQNSYMVMDLLGASLQDIRLAAPNNKLNIKTISLIANDLIQSLRCMHQVNILHRDLKPENVLLSKDSHRIYIVDFGLSKKCVPPPRKTVGIIGNVRYASRGAHLGMSSKMDDLESICYILLFLYQGWLPWQKLPPEEVKKQLQRKNTLEATFEMTPLLQMKHNLNIQMFEPTTNSKTEQLFLSELICLAKYIQSRPRDCEPDYEHIKYLVGRLMFMSGAMENYCYQWCKSPCPYELSLKRFWEVYKS